MLSFTHYHIHHNQTLFVTLSQLKLSLLSLPKTKKHTTTLTLSCLSLPPLIIILVFVSSTNNNATALPSPSSSKKPPRYQLSVDYYSKSCPQVDQLVASVTSQQFKQVPISGPATIRLFFHDCFVEGCDASVLISTKPGSKELAEKDAEDNKEIAPEAYDSINKAKQVVESKCPGIVSCADVLAIATRDFVHLAGGPYYQVKKGRWDGKISLASRVESNLPRPNSTLDEIIRLFSSKGLTLQDLVILSGAHTIGFAHCRHFVGRLYDYRGTKQPDPSVDLRLLKALKLSCPAYGGNDDVVAPLDVATPFAFDNAYYGNLGAKMGLLGSDQVLFLDVRTRALVEDLAKDKQRFFQSFAFAMEKMGSIGVKRGRRHGEKRTDCRIHEN